MKHFLLFSGIFTFLFTQLSFRQDDPVVPKEIKTKHIVILVIDGPRYTETFGDTACTYIPRMGRQLVKEGVLYTEFMNNGVTHTTPGHTAITTGIYQSIPNDGSILPKKPSIFQYYLKNKGIDKKDVWLISSKGKLQVLANTRDKKWWNMYMPSAYCGPQGNGADYVGDSETWKKIHSVFTNSAPKLTLINLLGVDVNGHAGDWEGYKAALRQCDEYAYNLWQLIQENPVMKDKTALFITNDHGRHLDGHKNGFVSHGDKCAGCKHISLLAMGPDFKKNVRISTPGELLDISKTISCMLKFEMPTTKGRVLKEMFN
ncbi:MAG: alkaline phosphatase family protein [Bacteroidota bacterium]